VIFNRLLCGANMYNIMGAFTVSRTIIRATFSFRKTFFFAFCEFWKAMPRADIAYGKIDLCGF